MRRPSGNRLAANRRRWSFEVLEDRALLAGDVVTFNDHVAGPASDTVHFNLPVNVATVQPGALTVNGAPATAVQAIDSATVQFALPAANGPGVYHVAVAEGAVYRDKDLPVVAYSGSFDVSAGSGIVINEINYDPGSDADPWEYVELFNAGSLPVDVSGWCLSRAVSFTIPSGTVLGSGQYLLISQHPTELVSRYGVTSLGPFTGRLANEGETVALLDAAGATQDEVDYQLGFPWPTIGDVPGRSIQLINPALANDLGGNWRSAPVTPGATNGVFASNSPPQMRQVEHSPQSPRAGQDVTITIKITDPQGVASASLEYQMVAPGDYIAINDARYATTWTSLPMHDDGMSGDAVAGDDVFTAVLPGSLQTHRRLVRYRVTAADALDASIRVPYADDPQPNFAYYVYDALPSWTGATLPGVTPPVTYSSELLDSIATYQLITTRKAHVDSQFIPDSTRGSGYGGSDYLWHGALVYDGVVFDHIRFRARGGVWRYAMGKNMWKFDFNRGHEFEARDNYGNKYKFGWSKLNLSAVIQQGDFWHRGEQGLFESVGFKLFELAGAPASKTNYVHFRIVESASESGASQYSSDFQGLYLAVEQLDDNFLEEHGLPDGNLYKMEGGTGVGGIGGESNNQGDYPAVDDSSDLIAFKTTYEGGPVETAAWWKQNLNLDSYYSYRSIVEAIHHYDIAAGKNYFYYLDPETNRWETLPWDLDLTWANNMYGTGNEPFFSRVLAIAEFALGFRNRMREIRDLLYNAEQVGILVDEMASFVYTPGQPSWVDADRAMWDYNPILVSGYVDSNKAGHGRFYAGGEGTPATGSYAGMMQLLMDYVVSRGAFIDSTILTDEAQIPAKPTIAYTGATGFPLDRLQFSASPFSSSSSAFGAMEWRIAEVYYPGVSNYVPGIERKYEINAAWESGELATFNGVLNHSDAQLEAGHTYRARVRMRDAAGRWSHWSNPVEFVAAPAAAPPLVFTELHYHPNNPNLSDESDQEFIEIMNVSGQAVDLSGVQISDFAESPYTFPHGISLAAGKRIVVARNPAVFTSIYGTGIPLAPAGYATANLSNAGETISLRNAAGRLIVSVTYDDAPPWPTGPDGNGPSLEIVDPNGDLNDPANWRASAVNGGSPGTDGSLPQAPGDYDHDGSVNENDFETWKASFGSTVAPGNGADGSGDGKVDAADYVVWRIHRKTQAASSSATVLSPHVLAASALATATDTEHPIGRRVGWQFVGECLLQREPVAQQPVSTLADRSAARPISWRTQMLLRRPLDLMFDNEELADLITTTLRPVGDRQPEQITKLASVDVAFDGLPFGDRG